ncbi:Cyclin-A2-2 [Carex littledalei]|uniref:Cyclin-A2-2 n=1 Tax=Carex littledalei TaxID=544730 RepID=A0A833VGX1_9POAL|nr:Cyclin-A2-2 [Carex littledalei]
MHLTNFMAELTLVEYSFLKFLPSVIASAAFFLAQWTLDQSTNPWELLVHFCNWTIEPVKYKLDKSSSMDV